MEFSRRAVQPSPQLAPDQQHPQVVLKMSDESPGIVRFARPSNRTEPDTYTIRLQPGGQPDNEEELMSELELQSTTNKAECERRIPMMVATITVLYREARRAGVGSAFIDILVATRDDLANQYVLASSPLPRSCISYRGTPRHLILVFIRLREVPDHRVPTIDDV